MAHDSRICNPVLQRPHAHRVRQGAHRAETHGEDIGRPPFTTTWVEMPPEDVERLIKALQDALAELGRE